MGDYLQFTCESVRVQSEMIQQLVDSSKRQNMLIHRLTDKVESMTINPLPEGWQLASPDDGLLQPPPSPPAQPSAHPLTPPTQPHLRGPPYSLQSSWTPELQAELAKQVQDYARIQLSGSAVNFF